MGNFVGELFAHQGLTGHLFSHVYPELCSVPTARHEVACASGSMAILFAMNEILAGHLDMSAVLGLELMRNVPGKTGTSLVMGGWLMGQVFIYDAVRMARSPFNLLDGS